MPNIPAGTTQQINNNTPTPQPVSSTTYTGAGTLQKTGSGVISFGGNGQVNISFSQGGLIEVVQGTLRGSSSYQSSYTNNLGGLQIDTGATFDGVEGTILVDALTGSGTLQGGFGTNNGSTTIGVAGGSGTFSGLIQDGVYGPMALIKAGSGTETLTGTNTYTRGTTISGGTLSTTNNGSVLSSGPVTVGIGATLNLSNGMTGTRLFLQGTTLSGSGTITKSGAGEYAFGNNAGTVNVSLGYGGVINVAAGTLDGSAAFQANYANNMGGLNIASGATFDGVEGTIMVDALTGAGTLQGGYGSNTGSTTIGVAGGSGTFSGVIRDGAIGVMTLIKAGTGTETLTGASTYTGGTTIKGGTLQLGNGTATGSMIGKVADGGILAFNEASGTPFTFAGSISNNGNAAGAVSQIGGTTVLTGINTYTGGTTVTGGTLEAHDNGSALSSGPVMIATGATLDLDNDQAGSRLFFEGATLSGAGTITKTGGGELAFGNNGGTVNVSLGAGGVINVAAGTLDGSAAFQANYASNMGSLSIASGATFDGVEGTILVDALTGSGTLQGGYGTNTGTTTIGVAGGDGTFSGVIRDGANGVMILIKTGTGTETLTGADTYTGGTTIKSGTLTITNGSALSSGPVVINAGATLNFNASNTQYLAGTTLSGAGTIQVSGNGTTAFGNNGGTVNIALSKGALINVGTGGGGLYGGNLSGSADFQANWANNRASLNIGIVGNFNGVEGNIVVDALTGSGGTLSGGYGGQGSTTIGVAGGSGTFNGRIIDSQYGALSLIKAGTGLETLADTSFIGKSSYTGGTTITGGTLELTTATAAGTGTITFANTGAAATLMIDAGAETQVNSSSTYTFSNQINGATSKNQIIDLTGLAYNSNETSANTATLSGGVLSVSNGTQTVKLTVGNASGGVFTTMADAGGGTYVMDPPTSSDGSGGKVDNSWISAAMQPFGAEDGGVGLQLGPTHDSYSAASLTAPADLHAALASGPTSSRRI